jgi:baculoviral IAP repeat-containing protein 6
MNEFTLVQRLARLNRKAKLVLNIAKGMEKDPEDIAADTTTTPTRQNLFYGMRHARKGHVSENASKNYAFQIATMICNVYNKYIEAKIEEDEEEEEVLGAELELCKENYVKIMRDIAFDTIDYDFAFHHYVHKKKTKINRNRKLWKRLASEFADLPTGLPIDFDSSVFFRVNEENVSFCQMLIIPCDGTPYASGCFLFDVCFPSTYPLVPPLVNLQTTGKGSIRFNPNLYACGKVCLSLLGTWGGANQGEQWNPGLSTMFQVALSIQSLIFVPQPYFNEPGYEASMGTPVGDKASKAYNQERQKATVRWAIIEMLQNPPRPFEKVVRNHFKMSKDRVMKNCKEWLGESHSMTKQVRKLLSKLK